MTQRTIQEILRELPGVDVVLEDPDLQEAARGFAKPFTTQVIRQTIDDFRTKIAGSGSDAGRKGGGNGASTFEGDVRAKILQNVCRRLAELRTPQIAPAINATGVIVHTGMGRSPLPKAAVEAVARVAACYSDVAVSRHDGGRRGRSSTVEPLLQLLTGCEAAIVTNNNAAATLLALHAIAEEREVIVSRGQLVEIGGSFRLPEVMTAAGAVLREVGTTNRTRIADYEDAIGDETAAILRVHPSNFRVIGFTESVGIEALVKLGRKHDVTVIDDIGSGAMIDFSPEGLSEEATPRASLEAGADLALFSGDKLLGGPQAGILVGKREAIRRCARNPLMRALRVDKMTIAALEATLQLYLEPERLAEELPLVRMIRESADSVKARAESLLELVKQQAPEARTSVVAEAAFVGGGSLPEQTLPSYALVIEIAAEHLEHVKRELRLGEPAVFARVRGGRVEFDLRTINASEIEPLAGAIARALQTVA